MKTSLLFVMSRLCATSQGWSSLGVLTLLLTAGCCSCPEPQETPRPFAFGEDTFSFANELRWDYHFDANGQWTGTPREPPPDYANHCFVLARAAKQFFWNVQFASDQPKATTEVYEGLIRKVMRSSARRPVPPSKRIVIPGYDDLYGFSQDWELELKAATGGGWRSYVQRGHWRMIFPFPKAHQRSTALRLAKAARTGSPAVVHLVDFPGLRINHAVVVFAMEESRGKLFFETYDPNQPELSRWLTYDQRAETFRYPVNNYFPGGRIKVYEVYCGTWY
jgi:hypothetical protein